MSVEKKQDDQEQLEKVETPEVEEREKIKELVILWEPSGPSGYGC